MDAHDRGDTVPKGEMLYPKANASFMGVNNP